jgi:L-lysine 6-transaminase
MTTTTLPQIAPADVHRTLARLILADGYDFVFDFEKSHGAWVHDSRTGREFQRMLTRVAQLKPSVSDVYSVEFAWFVDTFGRLAKPAAMNHAFFVEGGALGVENALKVAFDWKVRRNKAKGIPGEKGSKVIHFREAFHGRTGYTLSLTNTDPKKTDFFPKFPWPRIENPKLRFPVTPEVEAEVEAAESRALDQMRRAFDENPDDVACVIIEPIQAEGGDNHFRPAFLQAIERLARENDCLFIVDEVQTGVGMTGKMWAWEHFGITPDVMAFGKKTQVCGCMAGARVDEEPENVFKVASRINSTWGGGLTDMVRFGRYLEVIAEDRLVDNAGVVGGHLRKGLEGVQAELGGLMTNARGRGLLIAFDLPSPEARDKAHKRLIQDGLLLLTCGTRSIRFRPPLNLTAGEADTALEIVRKSLRHI